ncbi:hypothetical protein G3779_001739 [Campylobacter jejuni]|nr:hypothetical protein [Campylobacter jejuni]
MISFFVSFYFLSFYFLSFYFLSFYFLSFYFFVNFKSNIFYILLIFSI